MIMSMRHTPQFRAALTSIAWISILLCIVTLPSVALADAGAVRVSQQHGNRQITVFTDPTPLRAGPVDVSVLVQDATTGEAVLAETIEIEVAPRGFPAAAERYRATSAAATNKLLQAANFSLRHAGWWEFTINVRGPQDNARIRIETEAAEPLPHWQALWAWFCWPFLVIAFFALLRFQRLPG